MMDKCQLDQSAAGTPLWGAALLKKGIVLAGSGFVEAPPGYFDAGVRLEGFIIVLFARSWPRRGLANVRFAPFGPKTPVTAGEEGRGVAVSRVFGVILHHHAAVAIGR